MTDHITQLPTQSPPADPGPEGNTSDPGTHDDRIEIEIRHRLASLEQAFLEQADLADQRARLFLVVVVIAIACAVIWRKKRGEL